MPIPRNPEIVGVLFGTAEVANRDANKSLAHTLGSWSGAVQFAKSSFLAAEYQ